MLYPAGELIVKELDDFYFAFNVDSPNIIVMDCVGKDFLKLCDGKQRVGDILKLLTSKHPGKISEEELASLASSLVRNDFLATKPNATSKAPERPFDKLYKLYVNITHACNLKCKYCYINAGEPYEAELTEEEFVSQIRDFSELGGEELVITGGEPFLRKNVLRSIVTTARMLKIEKIDVETNGILVEKEDARFCARNNVRVCVGLGGASRETHLQVRGGGFEEAIKGTENLINEGVDTAMGMTITRVNVHEAEDFLKLAKNLGATTTTMNLITMVGRARDHPELEFSLNDAIPVIQNVIGEGQKLGIKTAFERVVMDTRQLPVRNLCGVGIGVLSIAANGDVYPCNSFQETPFKAGNVRKRSLREIWETSETIKMFRSLDISDIPECRDCEWKYICSGGCIAQTFQAYGTIKRCSPHCSYYRNVYSALIARLARTLWDEV